MSQQFISIAVVDLSLFRSTITGLPERIGGVAVIGAKQ